jgi:uncharacterized membrane protein YadS
MKVGFFEESEGVKSGTRLMCIPGFYAVLAMAGLMVWRGLDPVAVGAFLGAGLVAIGAVKVGGAVAEKKKEDAAG